MIFYGGGQLKNKALNEYFLINEEEGNIIMINGGRTRQQGGSCFKFPYVYIFGGCDGARALKFSDKFNINTMSWEELIQIPQESDTTVINFDGNLLLTGSLMTSVYLFLIQHNAYIEVLKNIPTGNKFLCCGNGKVYLLCGNSIYSTEFLNHWKWNIIKEIKPLDKYWITTSIRYQEKIYFTTGHYSFFEDNWPKARVFNLNTLELTEII